MVAILNEYRLKENKELGTICLEPRYLAFAKQRIEQGQDTSYDYAPVRKGLLTTSISSNFEFPGGNSLMAGLVQHNRDRMKLHYKRYPSKILATQFPVSMNLEIKFVAAVNGKVTFTVNVSTLCGRAGYVAHHPEKWELSDGKFRLLDNCGNWSAFGG